MSVPFLRTRRMPETSPTEVPSTESQSIEGCGLPEAEQSSHPPLEFENSRREGGSITNAGPRRCESKLSVVSVNKHKLLINYGFIEPMHNKYRNWTLEDIITDSEIC